MNLYIRLYQLDGCNLTANINAISIILRKSRICYEDKEKERKYKSMHGFHLYIIFKKLA